MSVRTRWAPLLVAAPPALEMLPDLARRYAEPHRAYHGLHHIDALARLFEDVQRGPGWRRPLEVALAVLYHDAVYVPGRTDNEACSARLARQALRGHWLDVDRVEALILATANHCRDVDALRDEDLAHFLDADMSILGTPPAVYDAYVAGVRSEYAAVPQALFTAGRRAFLESLLARATIFHSEFFAARFEASARANMARELASH
jgi:predicted metal-dependent HD superfamily phosphohydrolase